MSFTRPCPSCGETLEYCNSCNLKKAESKKSVCFSCSMKRRRSYKGKENPFFGKKHTDINIERFKQKDMSYTQTNEFRNRRSETSKSGKDNHMYGKSNYDFWVKKHGVEKADILLEEFKQKLSDSMSGENNPMFGKPSPQGSGNGWSGWYNGWYFRSLKELSYVVNVLEKHGLKWKSAETKDLRVPYVDFDGKDRTYRADFLVEGKYLVEVKPSKLRSSRSVRKKEEAAIAFCEENGLQYQIVDPPPLKDEEVKLLYESGKVVFLDKYDKKFKEEYCDQCVLRDDC